MSDFKLTVDEALEVARAHMTHSAHDRDRCIEALAAEVRRLRKKAAVYDAYVAWTKLPNGPAGTPAYPGDVPEDYEPFASALREAGEA